MSTARSLISLSRKATGVRRVRLHLAKTKETDGVREATRPVTSCGIQVDKSDHQYPPGNEETYPTFRSLEKHRLKSALGYMLVNKRVN